MSPEEAIAESAKYLGDRLEWVERRLTASDVLVENEKNVTDALYEIASSIRELASAVRSK